MIKTKRHVPFHSPSRAARVAPSVPPTSTVGDSWKATFRQCEEAEFMGGVSADAVTRVTADALTPSLTWVGKLLKYIRQIEVAINEGNETRVTQLVEASIRD